MTLSILALGLVGGLAGFLLLRAAPRTTVVVWVAVLFFLPVWVGVSAGPFWSAITVMTLVALATCSSSIKLRPVDGVMAALTLLIVGQFAFKLTSLSSMFTALTEWVLPYLWGRMILTRVSLHFVTSCLAVAATLAAALGIIEAASGTNVFIAIPPGSAGLYAIWGVLQERGGMFRVEGAFGHSIALGATLAMASAFVLAARWKLWITLSSLILIVIATTLTLSRIGLVTLVLTIGLSIAVLPTLSKRAKIIVAAAGGVAALIVVPVISDVFLSAGQEAGGSADYRWDLFSLFRIIPWFGSAQDFDGLTVDGVYFGDFAKSVDNAILVAALRVGLVPTALLLIVLLAAALPALRTKTASAAGIAVAGQLPGLIAVAFITQYAVVFWFVVGLAVASVAQRPQAQHSVPLSLPTTEMPSQGALVGFPRRAVRWATGGGV